MTVISPRVEVSNSRHGETHCARIIGRGLGCFVVFVDNIFFHSYTIFFVME